MKYMESQIEEKKVDVDCILINIIHNSFKNIENIDCESIGDILEENIINNKEVWFTKS